MENSPAVLFIISHEGFNTLEAAHIFHKLMERLGFTEFYVQGGDWGAFITNNMAQMKPECVCGLHLNMVIDRQPGLAAYILEKFSSWTDLGNTDFEDGGLKRILLTYALTQLVSCQGVIVVDFEFYAERTSVYVPSAFPDELLPCAGAWLGSRFTDVRSFTYMPRGGHFTAFEEPQLMAQDIIQFVEKVESKSHK
uniref:AB hydrolase-1 domain-containing protein n=1 Tax=Cyprinus carpio TaxID=7962 RepID=A0A8C1GUB9_CYPCA